MSNQERRRVDLLAQRLNAEYGATVRFETIRWETTYYKAHTTFQSQIPEASQCDIVVAIFWSRLGTELPSGFATMPDGEPYPSGTAYEVLSAIQARATQETPDVYVFKKTAEPMISLSDGKKLEVARDQWGRLAAFFQTWFVTPTGEFRAAFQTFDTTDEFERHFERLLRGWIDENVFGEHRVLAWPIELKGSPFCGLAPFEATHAPVFFGRSRDVARAIERIERAASVGVPFLLIVGASGVGKSSFVRAGIVPRLTGPGVVAGVDLWRVAIIRPGAKPIESVAHAIFGNAAVPAESGTFGLPEIARGDCSTWQKLADLLRTGTPAALDPILNALRRIGEQERQRHGHDHDVNCHLLLVIDQFDDLFAAGRETDRTALAKLLASLLETHRVWIVGTLRADLYEQYVADPDLLALKRDGASYDLAPPGPAELAEIVRRPAEVAGLIYERSPRTGETLDEMLLEDAGSGDVLPLIEFTLQQLFNMRQAADGKQHLTIASYEALGGLDGAIERTGEDALKSINVAGIDALAELFRHLVGTTHSDDTMGTARTLLAVRSAALAEFPAGSQVRKIVDALIAARLLMTSEEGGVPAVRLAHQRVLRAWSRARAAVAANSDYYRVISEIRQQCRRWLDSGGKPSLLLPKDILSQVGGHARRFGNFDSLLTDFIAASRWRQRIFRLGIVTAVAPLVFSFEVAFGGVMKSFGWFFADIWFDDYIAFPSFIIVATILALSPLAFGAILLRYGSSQKSFILRLELQATSAVPHDTIFLTALRLRLRVLFLNAIALLLIGAAFALRIGILVLQAQFKLMEAPYDLYDRIDYVIVSMISVWIFGNLLWFALYRHREKAEPRNMVPQMDGPTRM